MSKNTTVQKNVKI